VRCRLVPRTPCQARFRSGARRIAGIAVQVKPQLVAPPPEVSGDSPSGDSSRLMRW
jgi:hypothetical protein